MEKQLERLKNSLAEVVDLQRAAAILSWDQETYMPAGGGLARAEQLATLSKIAHEKFTTDEMGLLLEGLSAGAKSLAYDSDDAALIRVTRHDYEKARKLPVSLVAELTKTISLATEAWKKARAEDDFESFAPHLRRVLELTVQKAEAWGYEEHIYDALLDEYEPGMKSSQVAVIFKQVREAIVPLVHAIAAVPPIDDAVMHWRYPALKQWDFGEAVIKNYGFNFGNGRQDKSAHPFTTSFDSRDVRLTTRIMENYLPSALFSTMHEAGHGLYEQGFADSIRRTGLDSGASLGIHESQSRMWENIIGRSKNFWWYYYPRLQEVFPEQLGAVNLETFYRAINKVAPSFIRVEADEVTYNLHIFVRFEIERELLSGAIQVADLPEQWNARMEKYLGITPHTNAEGVLQDVHWSNGLLGYFPTYSLGNIYSVQFFNRMTAEHPDLPEQISRGEFGQILGWLRENIHRHGRKYTPAEMVERATGGPLNAQPYIDYITSKYRDIYGL